MKTKRDTLVEYMARNYKIEYPLVFNVTRAGSAPYHPKVAKSGYPVIGTRIRSLGINKSIGVHRIVAYQKYGDAIFSDGVQVRHINNNKLDFSCGNIEIGTAFDNHNDNSRETNEAKLKSARSAAKSLRVLPIEELESMILDRSKGMHFRAIAKKYGRSLSTVHYAISGRTYVDRK